MCQNYFDSMNKMKIFVVGFMLAIFIISPLALSEAKTVSNYDDLKTEEKYWKSEVWGSQATDTIILNEDFVSDDDVDTYLTFEDSQNILYLENTNARLENQVVDLTTSSFGKHSTDWLGTPNDADYPASAGVDHWVLNGSTNPSESNLAASGNPTSTVSAPSPASGGYKMTTTIYPDSTDSDATVESYVASWAVDGDIAGVDDVITEDSYLYIQAALKYVSSQSVAARKSVGITLWFSDGASLYPITFMITNITYAYSVTVDTNGINTGTTADDTWYTQAADTSIPTIADNIIQTATVGSRVFVEESIATSGTSYEFGYLLNIQNIIDEDSTNGISVTQIEGYSVWMTSMYCNSTTTEYATITLRNLMIVDNIKDASFYEDTDTEDTTIRQSDNFLNGTSLTLSDSDQYPLENGFDFALDVPINRLVLDSFDYIVSPYSMDLEANEDTYDLTRVSYFNLKVNSEEPFDAPTYSCNFTNLDANDGLQQIKFDSVLLFESDGDLRTGHSVSHTSSTFNEIGDIYDATISEDIVVVPDEAISTSDTSYEIEVTYRLTSAEYDIVVGSTGLGWIDYLKLLPAVILIIVTFGFAGKGMKKDKEQELRTDRYNN